LYKKKKRDRYIVIGFFTLFFAFCTFFSPLRALQFIEIAFYVFYEYVHPIKKLRYIFSKNSERQKMSDVVFARIVFLRETVDGRAYRRGLSGYAAKYAGVLIKGVDIIVFFLAPGPGGYIFAYHNG
jgi:hypothetical protein